MRRGGAVACALGVESASPRVLELIDKGAPVAVVSDVIDHLAAAGIAAEAMCFTDFPTETLDEALATLRFLDDRRDEVAVFIVGEFDLTHGALVAQTPERFGIREVWQLEGDTLGTGLFFEEETPPMRDGEPAQLDDALDTLSSSWLLRRYPWAGSLSTAHTVLYYDRHGRDVFRRLASVVRGGVIGASAKVVPARFDLDAAAEALSREAEAWQHLVRVARKVSRQAYGAVTADFTSLPAAPGRYRVRAGEVPVAVRAGARAAAVPRTRPTPSADETPGSAHVDQVVPGTHDHGAQEGGRVDAPDRPRHRGARRPRPAIQLQPDLRGAAPRGAEARAQAAQQIGHGRSGADARSGCSTTTPSRACRASPCARRSRATSIASCPPVARCDPTAAGPTSRCA